MASPTTTIDDVRAALIAVASQITGIGTCYSTPPEGPIDEGGVLFPLTDWRPDSQTNGRIRMRLTFTIRQFWPDRSYDEVVPLIESFAMAWWQVLGANSNQNLGGKALSVDLEPGGVNTVTRGGVVYLCLSQPVTVLTEFLIPA